MCGWCRCVGGVGVWCGWCGCVGDVGGVGEWRGLQNADTVEQADGQTGKDEHRHTYLHSSRPRDRTLEMCFLCTPEHSMHSKHP